MRELRKRRDKRTIILLTAGTEPRDFNPDVVSGTIRKPFDVELLYDTVIGCISVLNARPQLPGCPIAESEKRPEATGKNEN